MRWVVESRTVSHVDRLGGDLACDVPAQHRVYLGRQPILDRRSHTFGYELLYRSESQRNEAFFSNPTDASRTVIERAVLEWGIDHVANGRRVFINVGAELLHSGIHDVLPSSKVVLELLEDVTYDDATVAAVLAAHREGYRFALDDVCTVEQLPPPAVLQRIIVVKVDLPKVPIDKLRQLVNDLRARAPKAKLLAEKVEDHEQFRNCMSLGFDLFQGYFFARPEVLQRRSRPVNSAAAVALLVEVQRSNIKLARLEELINADPTLAYRLLTLVNSGLSGLRSRVESVHHGIVLLGIDKVRQLATLLTLAANSSTSEELVLLAVTRARMARLLIRPPDLGGSAFTVGLLSVIDALFHATMEELLDDLPLSASVEGALRDGAGPLGEVLTAIRAYEDGDLDTLERLCPGQLEEFRLAFGDSAMWAGEFLQQITAA